MVDVGDKPSGRHHEEAVPPPRVVGIEEEGGLEGGEHHHARNDAHEEAVVGHGEGTRGEERQGKRSHLGKEDKDGGEDTPRPVLMKAGLGTSLALELLTRGRRGAETQKGRHCQNGDIGYALYKPTYPVRHNHNLHSLITPTQLW